MKRTVLGLIVLSMLFPVISFAQKSPQTSSPTALREPASLIAFFAEQRARELNYYKKKHADRSAFLSTNPDKKASLAFLSQEQTQKETFFKQMKADRDDFLSADPDAKAYIDQKRAFLKAQLAAKRTAQQSKVND